MNKISNTLLSITKSSWDGIPKGMLAEVVGDDTDSGSIVRIVGPCERELVTKLESGKDYSSYAQDVEIIQTSCPNILREDWNEVVFCFDLSALRALNVYTLEELK